MITTPGDSGTGWLELSKIRSGLLCYLFRSHSKIKPFPETPYNPLFSSFIFWFKEKVSF